MKRITSTPARLAAALALVAVLALVPAALARPGNGHGNKGHGKAHKTYKVSRGGTTLTFDQATVGALAPIKITPLKPAKAKHGGAAVRFPITEGRLNKQTFFGKIRHVGGLKLAANGKQLKLRNFVINIDASPDLTARVGNARVSILNLELTEPPVIDGRKLTISGVNATLTPAAIGAINSTFGTTLDTTATIKLGTAVVKTRIIGKK